MGNKAAAGKAGRLGLLLTIGAVSAAIFAVGWALDRYWLPHQYVFDPEVLGRLAKANVAKYGDDATQLVPSLVADLREAYGDIVNEYNPEHWIINNAGGAMGFMFIIHASITEYVIIFGTPLGTEGHTGTHMADDYFYILQGEQWTANPGELKARVYRAGDDANHLARGVCGQYAMPMGQPCWALELAQGWIPAMLPFGMADMIISTLDYKNIYKTVVLTCRAMLKSFSQGKF